MHKKLPLILIAIIIAVFFLSTHIPNNVKEILYAISLSIKSIIIFILPLIIFSLLFKTMVGLSKRATGIIALILILVCVSNFTATFISHYVGNLIYYFDLSVLLPPNANGLTAAWSLNLPKYFANDKAMFAGIALGILLGQLQPEKAKKLSIVLNKLTEILLNGIVFLIPLFVIGFVIKLQADGVLGIIIKDYPLIFALIAVTQFVYITLAYALLNHCKPNLVVTALKNMLPAGVAGFSAMSSAAVMPLTITAAEKNADNKNLAASVIPATVNIHLIGDCIAIPILAFAVMKSFGAPLPSLTTYLVFVFYFVIAKFSVAAIPGGGILVMLPILESYLGFNSEMLSLITALYILFDPVITCANIFGNGAFSRLIDRIFSIRKKTINLDVSLQVDSSRPVPPT